MKIAYKSSFLKALQRLKDDSLRKALRKAIADAEQAQSISEIKDLKKLKGYGSYFRIRIGNYRIGLKWEEEEDTLYFVIFKHRKDIYKEFP